MTGLDLFPIQLDDVMRSVPWGLMEPHEAQAKLNHSGQSLKQLAARGGVMPAEALAIIENRKWEQMPKTAATLLLKEYAEAWLEDRPVRVAETIDDLRARQTQEDRADARLTTRPPVVDVPALIASDEWYLGAPVKAPPPAPDILTRLDKAISLATRGRSVIGPGSRHTMNELVATLEGIKLELYGKDGE